MKNLKELKEEKIENVLNTFECAMYENYFGGDTLIVKNIYQNPGDERFGIMGNQNQWFNANELEFIDRENILDKIREKGWKIEVQRPEDGDFVEVEWLFTAMKVFCSNIKITD